MEYRLVDVDPNDRADAERLADMFNDFDTAWPGGFNRGNADTIETVQTWLGRARRAAICAVEHDGRFVGFCDLMPFPGDPDRVYVNLLGARLAHHGRGVGKMLLLEMVHRACSQGCRQLSLHTWAGNTKAVPLYKRTGFQWVPDSDVHMENFMPTILAMPVAQAFFSRVDWYDSQQREVALVPDDRKWRGMPAYEYRFRNGEDFLHVWIDRASGRVTAVETPAFLVGCSVPVEEIAAGESCPIEWVLESRLDEPVDAAIAASPDDGLECHLHERIRLLGEHVLSRDLRVAADARRDVDGDPPHRILTSVLLGDDALELHTGVKVARPVELVASGCGCRVGRAERLRVTLRSHLDRELRGTLSLATGPKLECRFPSVTIHLPERSWTECVFEVTARRPGVHTTALRLQAGNVQLGRELAVRAHGGAEALASVDDHDEMAVLEDAHLRVESRLRGGTVRVYGAGTNRRLAVVAAAEVGPPFSGYRVRPDTYRAQVEETPVGPTLVLSRDCSEIQGLRLERRLRLEGAGLLLVEHRLTNTDSESRSASLRLHAAEGFVGNVTYPLVEGLVREPFHGWGYYPQGATDVLPIGGHLAESWCACDNDDGVTGLIWHPAEEERVGWDGRLPSLTYSLGEIPPHGSVDAPPVWLIACPGSWAVVRDWWRRVVRPAEPEEYDRPVPGALFEVRTEPSPAILRPGQDTLRVVAVHRGGNTTSGTVEVTAGAPGRTPASRAQGADTNPSASRLSIERRVIALPELDRDHPVVTDVAVRQPDGPYAAMTTATARLAGREHRFELPVIGLEGPGQVALREEEGTVLVDNGALRFRVAPAFGGSVTSLESAGRERLRSSWPEARPFVWAGHWFGGVHPAMDWIAGPQLAREPWSGGPVERIRLGVRWVGAGVVCRPTHRDRRWLQVEADYLTLPGSNVMLILTRWANRTTARRELEHDPCLAVWLAEAGEGGTEAHWVRNGRREVQHVGEFSRDMRSSTWAAVVDPASDSVTVLVPGSRKAKAYVEDFAQHGQHLGMWMPMTLEPGETREIAAWLVFCSTAEVEVYAALRDVTWATDGERTAMRS